MADQEDPEVDEQDDVELDPKELPDPEDEEAGADEAPVEKPERTWTWAGIVVLAVLGLAILGAAVVALLILG